MTRFSLSRTAALLAVTASLLAGCGVDGPPERPAAQTLQQQGKVTVSGDARIGVVAEL